MTEQTSRKAAGKPLPLNASAMNTANHISHELWRHPDDLQDRDGELSYWQELARLIGIDHLGEDHSSAAHCIIREDATALDQNDSSAAANKKVPA
ncbi:hypothetical protein G6L94_32455 [Agrobacterium rhizogenes]|uniref:hypothetical protein n=1 Tax=Rhizobium rhizogenes TaxID=359 RepID=UPI00080F7976|nr:hypothetical protein [Rhizobium rhizogenes]OCJ22477.1 hypothetical protein A6U88_29190 [Agrobacterium sp. B131/95]OCJ28533.1 hypothetical protein A6U89_28385 [Agrobacterium sp. B133/95]NTI46346.1 hypothetical protein [Rhizobium rhizogenes]NTI53030.1 hypothetical protein [Rhizobium rhizogenes]NTI98403.1 hypothetical protein [Rhizobium rhizogenes]